MLAQDKVVMLVEGSVVVDMGEVAEVGVVVDEFRSCLYSADICDSG